MYTYPYYSLYISLVHHFQVFVFGSFTEDEINSLQSTPKENDVQFMFGSLDPATLRSVGIFNNRPSEIEIAKKQLHSKLVKKSNTDEIVHKNGNIHDSSSLALNNGIKEHEQKDTELPVSFVPESVDQSISQQCIIEAVTVSSTNQGNEAFGRSLESLDINDTKNNILTASNGLHKTTTELLPRGLVNSGNLCFLNATLQALLACSPFVHLLQELRMCNIPEVDYNLLLFL